jgi:hypothetical protein
MDAVQRLELREQFAKVRADNDARVRSPLTITLYIGSFPKNFGSDALGLVDCVS